MVVVVAVVVEVLAYEVVVSEVVGLSRGGAIPLLACAETRVLALCSPGIELCFCFRPPGCTVQNVLTSAFRIVFVRCFPVRVAFCIGFYSIFADSRLSAHAGLDLHFSFSSVWGVEG